MKLSFKNWLVQFNEMPITNMTFQGSWGPKAKGEFGYNWQDLGILENPNATEKIMKKWSNTKENFEVHFVRSEKAQKHRQVGEVSKEWVKEELDFDVQPQPDTITVIFTQNESDEKVPMTAWTLAHRVGHAIFINKEFLKEFAEKIEKDFLTLLDKVYNISSMIGRGSGNKSEYAPQNMILLGKFVQEIGTMSSARNKRVGNFVEFLFELVAQYIITGKIRFKSLPRTFTMPEHESFGEKDEKVKIKNEKFEKYNARLGNYAKILEKRLDKIFNSLRNKIFVQ